MSLRQCGIWYYTINKAMDENTVFSNTSQGGSGAIPKAPQNPPVQPVTPPSPIQQPPPIPVVPPPPAPPLPPQPIKPVATVPNTPIAPQPIAPSVPPPSPVAPGGLPPVVESIEPKRFPFARILKILLALIIVGALFLVTTIFILPRFQGTSTSSATLTYWGLWENEGAIKALISDFERENPQIKVNYEKQDVKQYRERLNTRIQNGTGPDIFRYHNTWYPMFKGTLAPLSSDVFKKEDFEKNYYTLIKQDVVRDGAIYGVPLGIDVLALYVNKDIFTAAGLDIPTTWDAFASTARKLTVKDEQQKIKTAGAALGTFDNINHAPDIISLLLVQNGADLENLQDSPQNASDALSFYTSFANDESKVWDETLDPSMLMFIKGNLAMYFGYSWDVFAMKASNPNLPFEIYPVPHLPNRNMTIGSYWVEGVSSKSKYQKESMIFMKFLAKKETQQKLFTETSKVRLFGEPYARIDLAESLKDNALVYPFVLQAKEAVSSFFAADTYDNGLNSQMNAYLGNAVRAILNNDSPQTAIETLGQGVRQVLNQYSK